MLGEFQHEPGLYCICNFNSIRQLAKMNGGMSSKCLGSFSVNIIILGAMHFYGSPRNLRGQWYKNKNNSLQLGKL